MFLSVIIPVYNAERYLKSCLDSVLCQTDAPFELILVDDGSTDSSGALCDAYASRDARVRVIHKKNGGQVSARRQGILAARGAYIGYVDADDTVRPDWLAQIVACLRENGEPDMLAFGVEEHTAEGARALIPDLREGLYDLERLRREVFPYVVCDRRKSYTTQLIYPVAWNKVYRRELLEAHHCRDERIRRGEDTAFVYECLLNARSLCISHCVLYDYNRAVPDSISGRFGFRLTENDVYLAEYLRSHLAECGVEKQINDFVLSKIIRSVLWRARLQPPQEAQAALAAELRETGLLRYVRFRGLPPGPAAFLLALRLRLYGPLFALARKRNSSQGAKGGGTC